MTPLMAAVPQTAEQMAALKAALARNPRTAAVIAEFRDGNGGFRGIMDKVAPIVERVPRPRRVLLRTDP